MNDFINDIEAAEKKVHFLLRIFFCKSPYFLHQEVKSVLVAQGFFPSVINFAHEGSFFDLFFSLMLGVL